MSEGAATALVIPVPEVAGVVPDPRIPLLDPFLPRRLVDAGVLAELTELFAEVVPFEFTLGEPARLPSGQAYLPPRPTSSFRHLAQELRRAFPELSAAVPSLEAAVPHLPVPDGLEVRTVVTAHARTAELRARGAEEVLATFPFGTSAA